MNPRDKFPASDLINSELPDKPTVLNEPDSPAFIEQKAREEEEHLRARTEQLRKAFFRREINDSVDPVQLAAVAEKNWEHMHTILRPDRAPRPQLPTNQWHIISGMTDLQLLRAIILNEEKDWKAEPDYYRVIIEETVKRKLLKTPFRR